MKIFIPNREELTINTVILDLNGTLAVGGRVVAGVDERMPKLQAKGLRIILFSADTRGNAATIASNLGIELLPTKNSQEKVEQAKKLNPEECVSIGNGFIDLPLMEIVKLSIVTLQSEGVHVKTFLASDIIVPSICDALDLLIDESRLIASLRT